MTQAYLGIDSATPFLSLALWSPEAGVLARFGEEVGRAHAARLILELDALLGSAGLERGGLRGIGVGTGPGSYTGLRVGIATAKGLARSLGIPASGHGTLAAIAFGCLAEGEEALVAMDARRGNVYAQPFRRLAKGVTPLAAAAKAPRAELRTAHPELRFVEGGTPDAAFLARRAYEDPGDTVRALYL